MNPIALLQEMVFARGPAGQEGEVREAIIPHLVTLGVSHEVDAKGNLIVLLGEGEADIVVTAHMDEIAMIVRQIHPDGTLSVSRLGGIHAWKLGEGPVEILASRQSLLGVFGFGGIHTEDPTATSVKARTKEVDWTMGTVFTGLDEETLAAHGVRVGTRVVVAKSRRTLTKLNNHIAGHFLDDRADLVSWLLSIAALKDQGVNVAFVATAAEEVGGEGALYFLQKVRPSVCIALELGASVPDARIQLTDQPTVWAQDSYATPSASDLDLIDDVARQLSLDVQFQVFSRGGSDASCAASRGLCARPLTLGIPMENSHGYEIMHKNAMNTLAELTTALVLRIAKGV